MADHPTSRRIAIIAGGGTLPLAVARAIAARGDVPVLFAIKGFCDPAVAELFPHHWIALGQFGRLFDRMQSEHCRTVVPIGALVRPAVRELRLDLKTILLMPTLIGAFRGGDDHLLTRVARIFETHGFEMAGVKDVAPELMVPPGVLTRRAPDQASTDDISRARAALAAISAFDVGQAAVTIDGHIVALEDIDGTDALLARVARLRKEGRIRAPAGRGVLVKAPKSGQDLRFDMPALGPKTVEGAEQAQLAGVAVIANQTLLAEPQAVVTLADRFGLFVTGLSA
jgi:DUF1009 family protein